MDVLKHVLMDGTVGFVVGATVDGIFEAIAGTTDAPHLEDLANNAKLVARLAAQAFVAVSLGANVSEMLYTATTNDDPTNGYLMMWVMFQASPALRNDLGHLTAVYKDWLRKDILGGDNRSGH
jgi:hypothetical protein